MTKKAAYVVGLKEQFFKLPNRIFGKCLKPSVLHVFAYLVSCGEGFNPGVRKIAKDTGLSKGTVESAIRCLRNQGMLRTLAARKGTRQRYEIIPCDLWEQKDHIEVGQILAQPGQETGPQVGRKEAHIQKDQDVTPSKETGCRDDEGKNPQLLELLGLVTPLFSAKKFFQIPPLVSEWLEQTDPEFSVAALLTKLKPYFYGPKGHELFQQLSAQLQDAWEHARQERERNRRAAQAFAMECLGRRNTEGKRGEEPS
jgi:hypothetical protein